MSQPRFIRVGVAALTGAVAAVGVGREVSPIERSRDAVALAMFSAVGGMLLASATDLITMYMALELSTMPAYVLVGYRTRDVSGLEGALKYFLLSLLTSLIMLYGMSFLYGLSGSTALADISLAGTGALGLVAALLTTVGLLAKLSAAPFHFWAPDAYAGAPASTVAFVSTVPKIAGAAILVRLTAVMLPGQPSLAWMLLLVASASMLLGNLAALPQSDTRRLMAYSGVAHTGYLLLALSTGTPYGFGAVLFYALAYAVPSLAIMLVVAEEGDALTDLAGLATRRPATAWAMVRVAALAHRYPAARRVLRQAVPVRVRNRYGARLVVDRRGRSRSRDERGFGRLLLPNRARDVLRRDARRRFCRGALICVRTPAFDRGECRHRHRGRHNCRDRHRSVSVCLLRLASRDLRLSRLLAGLAPVWSSCGLPEFGAMSAGSHGYTR